MKTIVKLLIASVFVLAGFQAKATHAAGGEITWECTSNGQYIFTMNLYRECGGNAANLPASTTISGQGNIPVTRVAINNTSFPGQSCSPPINCTSASGVGAVEQHVYKSQPITLTGTPPAGGWVFTWNICCRPGTVVNGPSNGFYYLRAIMYPYTPLNSPSALPVNPCFDNSPYFEEEGSLTICKGKPFTYNHLAADKDIDSLWVRWADPWTSANGTPAINWAAGYSTTSPYPNPNTNAANGPITLNGATGAVSMNVQNATAGSYASCYAVESWKYGQGPNGPQYIKVAEVFRDVNIVIHPCNATAIANNPPVAFIDTNVYTSLQKISASEYKTRVFPGDTVEFELQASDFDFNPNGSPQNITFEAVGLQASSPKSSGTGCNGANPCAQFFPIAPQVGYTNSLNNNIRFFWVPDCQHLGLVANLKNPINKFLFSLRMEDDACPVGRVSITTVVVEVVPGDPTPPVPTCLSWTPPSGDLQLQWDRAVQDSGLDFNYYRIFGAATRGGPYSVVDSIANVDSLSTIISASSGLKHFYMVKSTGNCDFISAESDTLSLIELSLSTGSSGPSAGKDVANLSWTPVMAGGGSGPVTYDVYLEVPAGSGNYVFSKSTTNLNLTDTIQVCDDTVNIRVVAIEQGNSCGSISTIVTEFFEDKSNIDQIVIDTASVNAAGNSILSWKPSSSGDIVQYYIFFNNPKLGWTVVDTVAAGTPFPYEWTDSEANSRPEEFRVISVDSCDNQSDDAIVNPHRTIYARSYVNRCEAFSRVSWNTYKGIDKDAVGSYRLLFRTGPLGGPASGPYQLLFTGSSEDTAYTHRNLQNATRYYYKVQVTDTTGNLTSTSNEIFEDASVPRKSKLLYVARVTNNFNLGSLDVTTHIDGQADVESFEVERAPDPLGPWQVVGQVGKPATAPYTIDFSDFGAQPSSTRYWYRLSATDSCGGRDTVSNLGSNILLKADPRADLTNFLKWNPYRDWMGEVGRYEIFRKGEEEIDFALAGTVDGDDTTFADDVSAYGATAGGFCYYIRAVEANNPLALTDQNGQPYAALSNQTCLNQQVRAFVPTAFRPSSEVAENREFAPSMRFQDVERYKFYVMNRWGAKVFESSEPGKGWDGTDDSGEAAQGVYVYYLRFKTPGGQEEEQRGSFTLIR